ncbi:hypothetical protein BCD67_24725 [Oscillatoriales cyanobacterium USR001]|nr:hypothetical protein BCD67_24725 [Oscillatoriales cyanobacterium USR001]
MAKDASQATSPSQQTVEEQIKDLKQQVGNQFATVYALITPDDVAAIKVSQEALEYFDITPHAKPGATIWKPRQQAASGNKEKTKSRESAQQRSGVARGKLVRIPVNFQSPPARKLNRLKGKGSAKKNTVACNRKYFYFRIPYAMSIDALVVWINNCFKKNKPNYFIQASGKTWYINDSFKDASKLAKIGIDSGEARSSGPEQKPLDAKS